MENIKLSINGQEIEAAKGTTILKAALANGIYIPHLCYHPELEPQGACRLCIVEIGDGELVTSCRVLVEPGMQVKTKSPKIARALRPVVELLIANHHVTCKGCASSGKCELQKVTASSPGGRVDRKRVQRLLPPEEVPHEDFNGVFDYNPNKCVLCGICVNTCAARQKLSLLHFTGRGYGTKVSFYGDRATCEACRECAARCPVKVLVFKEVSA
jgi:NADH dehydrogenase/NADH:ubiquinone oxidoreductase subunit G